MAKFIIISITIINSGIELASVILVRSKKDMHQVGINYNTISQVKKSTWAISISLNKINDSVKYWFPMKFFTHQ